MSKLGIIGGSGLYNMEGLENSKWIKVNTPWGSPSDDILQAELKGKEIFFLPRHGRGHKINPSNINFTYTREMKKIHSNHFFRQCCYKQSFHNKNIIYQ